jgi:putative ABC transport system permease protein
MLDYYLRLALISFRRNPMLTLLTVGAIALGVAMAMTAFTILYVMSRDPIPTKSERLFAVQLDNGGPASRKPGDHEPPTQLTYRDALALLNARAAPHQVAMHQLSNTVTPDDTALKPFSMFARATSADFFAMFDVPMLYGQAWGASADAQRSPVIVLSRKLNERLFKGRNSVGRTVDLAHTRYQVIGVTDSWDPKPRFYDVIGGQDFDAGEEAYLPLTTSIARGMTTSEYEFCNAGSPGKTFEDLLRSECVWLQFWVELPHDADVAAYRTFLINYAQDQRRAGRFRWDPNVRLMNVRDWLVAQKTVPNDARLSVIVAAGFFVVCLVSVLGLMLAKVFGQLAELGLRRALGASGRDIFSQAIVESGVVGLLGGIGGVTLTLLSLQAIRSLFPAGMGRIAQMDMPLFVSTVVLAILATSLVGFYPAWRSTRVAPALQMKGG